MTECKIWGHVFFLDYLSYIISLFSGKKNGIKNLMSILFSFFPYKWLDLFSGYPAYFAFIFVFISFGYSRLVFLCSWYMYLICSFIKIFLSYSFSIYLFHYIGFLHWDFLLYIHWIIFACLWYLSLSRESFLSLLVFIYFKDFPPLQILS